VRQTGHAEYDRRFSGTGCRRNSGIVAAIRHLPKRQWGTRAVTEPLRTGIALASQSGVVRLLGVSLAVSPLPATPRRATTATVAIHAVVLSLGLMLARHGVLPQTSAPDPPTNSRADQYSLVFVSTAPSTAVGSGGGGGGNRQPPPIRRAEGVGSDRITLKVARPIAAGTSQPVESPHQGLVLDSRSFASGAIDQSGLPSGGVPFGASLGPGSGGGVGEGLGSGIGPGRGPGVGPGYGGGTGTGPYRPDGVVTTPRLLKQARPAYTSDALEARTQGSVVLELVVRADGTPGDVRVVRSLDTGLDDQAVLAVLEWRFEPGRKSGTPVDVLVTVVVDFRIR
jgi:TonB family protein